jgi:hypothetical protein
MLTEARARKEQEKSDIVNKDKQLIIREDHDDGKLEGDEEKGAGQKDDVIM